MTAAPASDIAIDVKGLSKSFGGREVVHDLSMQVKRGTIYGFLGPNGSGKTTTIRMLCGLLTPDSGEGTCLGYDIRRDADKIKRQVGYMTQRRARRCINLECDTIALFALMLFAMTIAVTRFRRTLD